MPMSIQAPRRRVTVEPLLQETFAPFGTVIVNPQRTTGNLPINAVPANQGTALKYVDVSQLINYYPLAASKRPAKPVINMFVCSPRALRHEMASESSDKDLFDVNILERHPFTPQTFIPVGLSPDDSSRSYLVIVAPTLPSSAFHSDRTRASAYPLSETRPKCSILDAFSKARPSPFTNEVAPTSRPSVPAGFGNPQRPKGTGLPDLTQIRAYLARGDQAVTYAAGTWHAPMVVLGSGSIDFVVVQYSNGVGPEACQEVELPPEEGREGVAVEVDTKFSYRTHSGAKL